MQATTKKISFNFKSFIDNWALKDEQSCEIKSAQDAELIMMIDKDEQFTHVQLPDDKTSETSHAVLWNKKDWDSHYSVWLSDRKKNNKERMRLNLLSENIKKIKYALSRETGHQPELFDTIARTIAVTGNVGLAKQFGVNNLEILTEEQIEQRLIKLGYES